MSPGQEPDLQVLDAGSLVVVEARTDLGVEWIRENVSPEGFQPDHPTRIYVEPRYLAPLLQGAEGDGLSIGRR